MRSRFHDGASLIYENQFAESCKKNPLMKSSDITPFRSTGYPVKEAKVKASVSTAGVEIEAQGGAASRIGDALADAISPFSQVLGLAGDHIQIYRIYRQVKLIETLRRAKEIQETLGIDEHPVSPKLLSHWIEKASLEPDHEQNVTELWAMLLAKSPEEFSALHAFCVDVLSKLGSLEAQVFQKICEGSGEGSESEYKVYESINLFAEPPKSSIVFGLEEVIGSPVTIEQFLERSEEVTKEIRLVLSSHGTAITEFEFYKYKADKMDENVALYGFDDGLYKEFTEEKTLSALDILSYYGLVIITLIRSTLMALSTTLPCPYGFRDQVLHHLVPNLLKFVFTISCDPNRTIIQRRAGTLRSGDTRVA